MGKPVRMADIAEKLDISVVSVSKALAGKSGVSDEMRAKIVALAKQMGYEGVRIYNEPAGGGNIGVLVADRFFGEDAFYANLYRALVLKSGGEGLACMMEIISPEAERGNTLPALVAGRKVDGLLFMGNLAPDYLKTVADCGLPFIMLDFHIPGCAQDCIVSDNMDGGFLLTEHLLNLGRRDIGFVGSIRTTSSIMDRYLGYQRALRLAGIVPKEEWLLEDRGEDGKLIPVHLPDSLPEAFVCSNDEVAYHLVDALRLAGKRVPEDVAVCGYDDFRFAALCRPPLTTYQVNAEGLAETAVRQLSRKMRGEFAEPVSCTVPGRLIVRESCGAALKK